MASKGNKALSGAASGAAAGASFGPWGALIGGVAGAAGGLLSGDDPSLPAPPQLPSPYSPGAISGAYGGWTYDPVTGAQNYVGGGPSNGGDAASIFQNKLLMDRLMGGNGSGVNSDLASQIAAAQAEVNKYQAGPRGPQISDFISSEFIDPKTGQPYDSSWWGNPNAIDRNSEIFKRFQRDTGGNYGSKNQDISFGKWLKDVNNKEFSQKYQNYQDAQKKTEGNKGVYADALAKAQANLKSLQGIQGQMGASKDALSDNPFFKFLDNSKSTGDPFMGDWNTVTANALEKAKNPTGLDEYFKAHGLTLDGNGPNGITGLIARLSGGPQLITPETLQGMVPADYEQAMNAQLGLDFENRAKGQEQLAARRGMLSSAVNELAHGDDALKMAVQRNMNHFNAQKMRSDLKAQDIQNQMQAASQNNAANAQWGSMMGSLQGQQFGQGLQAASLDQQLRNQWQKQAADAINQRNAMDQYQRGIDQQNFANRLQFGNFLQGQQGQTFQQEMGRGQLGNQQIAMGQNLGMGMGNAWNQKNTAQAGMQMNYDNANWQQGVSSQNNLMGSMGQLAGAAGGMFGNYMSNQTPYTTGYTNSLKTNGIQPAAYNQTNALQAYNPEAWKISK